MLPISGFLLPCLTQVDEPNLANLLAPLPLADQGPADSARLTEGNDVSQGAPVGLAAPEPETEDAPLCDKPTPVMQTFVPVKQEPISNEADSPSADTEENLKEIKEWWKSQMKMKQEKVPNEGRVPTDQVVERCPYRWFFNVFLLFFFIVFYCSIRLWLWS